MKTTLNDTEAQLMSRLLDAEWALMHSRADEALSQVREANRLAGLVCDAAASARSDAVTRLASEVESRVLIRLREREKAEEAKRVRHLLALAEAGGSEQAAVGRMEAIIRDSILPRLTTLEHNTGSNGEKEEA